MDLLECRNKLDVIDKKIVKLFEERMDICGKVAETKIASGKAVYDAEREKQKLDAVSAMADSEFNQVAVRELFSQMMSISRKYQYSILAEHGRAMKALTAMRRPFSILERKQKFIMWPVLRMP